jgi:hypothetical protein
MAGNTRSYIKLCYEYERILDRWTELEQPLPPPRNCTAKEAAEHYRMNVIKLFPLVLSKNIPCFCSCPTRNEANHIKNCYATLREHENAVYATYNDIFYFGYIDHFGTTKEKYMEEIENKLTVDPDVLIFPGGFR